MGRCAAGDGCRRATPQPRARFTIPMRLSAPRLLACLLLASPALSQSTWYVDAAAPGPGSGTAIDPFARIDFAVSQPQVAAGDRVEVSPGIYSEEAIDLVGKHLVIEAAGAPGSVVIEGADGGGDSAPFLNVAAGGSAASTLRGLRFTSFEESFGSAVAMVTSTDSIVRLEACTFDDNFGSGAAMIAIDGGSVFFDGCAWMQNSFGCNGLVAASFAELSFDGCDWDANDNPVVALGGSLRFERNTFTNNFTSTSCGSDFGGLMRADQSEVTVIRSAFLAPAFATSKPFQLRDCATVFEGVQIEGGTTKLGPGAGVDVFGGTFACSDSEFRDLYADRGGAASLKDVDAVLTNCVFEGNRGDIEDFEGGAIHSDGQGSLLVEGCTFIGNSSGLGGAMGVNFVPTTIRNSVFEDNRAIRGTFFDGLLVHGGAVYGQGAVTVEDCTFAGNQARSTYTLPFVDQAFGGALALGPGSVVRRSTFSENRVEAGEVSSGGAIWAEPGTVVERCIFDRNHAGDTLSARGGALGGQGLAEHCTFLGSTTTGAGSVAEAWQVRNSILMPEGVEPALDSLASVEFSFIETGWPGPGNLAGDPGLWGKRNPHLMPGSPAIDVASGAPDLDGSPPDMGALPYDPGYCSPACTGVASSTYCTAAVNSTGLPGRTFLLGSDSVAVNLFLLAADQLPPGAPGYFLASAGAGFEGLPGGVGQLCLAEPLLRWVGELGAVNAAGQYGRMIRLDQLPGGQPVMAGETWHFQFWFQDMAVGLPVANTSSGVSVTFQ